VTGTIEAVQETLVKKMEDAVERQDGGRSAHRR
jgi:hypothetical protein